MTNEEYARWIGAFAPTTWNSIRNQWKKLHPEWTDAQLDAKADDLYNDYLESKERD